MNRAEVLRAAMPGPRRFAPGLIFGVLSAASAVALIAVSGWLIVRAAEQPPILFLSMAVVGVRAFALARAAFRYVERLSSHDAAFRQLATLRAGVYERLVPVAPDGLGRIRRGDLVARVVNDVDALQDRPLRVVQPLIVSVSVAALSVVGVVLLSPAAGLALLAALVLAFVLGSLLVAAVARRADDELAPLRGELAERINALVTRLDVLIAFDALEGALQAIDDVEARLGRVAGRRALAVGLSGGVIALASGAAVTAALAAGAVSFESLGGPALGVIVLTPLAVFEVFAMVPLALSNRRTVLASAERVADLDRNAASPALADDAEVKAATVAPVAVDIELDDVEVSWPEAARPALTGVSLRIAAGDRVLITGSSGSGKTSLAHALVRFLDYRGSYRIGGAEVRSLPQDAVRARIGLVEQTPYLFDESIRQNLLFADDTADDERLRTVLHRVGLGDWLASRGGLDAPVGERGVLVSGGQAQRIALARALLADFPVLVLDEPTASVDAPLADALLADVLAASAGRTVILIAHRVDPQLAFDRHFVVEAGRVLPV
ncbi:thiol reductant ABC exporter subunit CydC [Microbacteriaceae bacterium VKM Ac-2855]|nr:thiol reductant ABC exporter subunit CydC [Microbacteriaceae bacterium VKM Ac-2855]